MKRAIPSHFLKFSHQQKWHWIISLLSVPVRREQGNYPTPSTHSQSEKNVRNFWNQLPFFSISKVPPGEFSLEK